MNGEYVYLSATENAIFFRKHKSVFNAKCKHNVFEFPAGTSKIHPTEKNHSLLADLIKDNTNEKDVVLDTCAGSGSTLLVAHKLNRNFIGFELNKEYFEKANERLKAEQSQVSIFDFIDKGVE